MLNIKLKNIQIIRNIWIQNHNTDSILNQELIKIRITHVANPTGRNYFKEPGEQTSIKSKKSVHFPSFYGAMPVPFICERYFLFEIP